MTIEDTQPVDQNAIIVDSLAMQIARLSVEVAQWRARAIAAEQREAPDDATD